MISTERIIEELKERIDNENRNMKDSRKTGHSSPGFNQDLGARDALVDFLKWIQGEDR